MPSRAVFGQQGYNDQFAKALGQKNASYSLLHCSMQNKGGLSVPDLWSLLQGKSKTLIVARTRKGRNTIGAYLAAPWSAKDTYIKVAILFVECSQP
jgi:hypothetical protein